MLFRFLLVVFALAPALVAAPAEALALVAARAEALALVAAPAEDRLDRAIEKLRANRVAEARAELEAIVEAQPRNARAHAYLAAAEIKTGDVELAIARARRLLEADPDDADLHDLLGQARMLNRQWTEAEKHWRAVIRQRPNSEEAHFQLATTLLQLGNTKEGLEAVARAVEINPRRSDARALRGNLLASLGRADEAAKEWIGALAIDGNNVAALSGLAVHLRLREPEQALEHARRAVELSNWEAAAPIRILALVHRSRGDVEQAREVLRRGLRKLPDEPALAAELRSLQAEKKPAPSR